VLEFLFDSTDVRVFESYAECGQELREFSSMADLQSTFPIGCDPAGNSSDALLQLYSPSAYDKYWIRHIDLIPKKCAGHTFRFAIEGYGLIQLYLGGVHENCSLASHRKVQPRRCVTTSHLGYLGEKRAVAWDIAEGVNWPSLSKTFNKIQYHVRSRLAVARVPGRPVLAQAFDKAREGYPLRESAGTPWQYDLVLEVTT